MSARQVEWLTDMALAASELGYSFERIERAEVVLVAENGGAEVVIRSTVLSGAFLLDLLRPAQSGKTRPGPAFGR